MSRKILIVEDEIFIALEVEAIVRELGHESAGIAADSAAAMKKGADADVALVDLNLADGPTGVSLGRKLRDTFGLTVLYVTANPSQLGDGVPGTLGVVPKPVTEREMRDVISYAVAACEEITMPPPRRMRVFSASA
ncbi:response regulator (plasmid) [Paroceanicella profunda]|uniref:Response regulator n=1 Tax=Paroceanicella profunda TaxID=2579971 RepID=A0A5B8FYA8_9RHOB|nr:response regulator [Paroceanicella profunda]QDL93896.1 response regulator [Paroceanicella profunda]